MDRVTRERERALFPGIGGAIGLVAAVLAAEIVSVMVLRGAGTPLQIMVLAMVLGNGIVLGAYLGKRSLRYRDVLHPGGASVGATLGLLAVPVLLVAPALFLAASVLDMLREIAVPMSDSQREMFAELLRAGLASTLALVVAAPFFEELVFRGIVLRGLLARMAPWQAIVASAVVFGAAHLNLAQFVGALFLGVPLGWMYWRFRSTLPCMILHAAHNGMAIVAAHAMDDPAGELDVPLAGWVLALGAFLAGAGALRLIAARLRQSGHD